MILNPLDDRPGRLRARAVIEKDESLGVVQSLKLAPGFVYREAFHDTATRSSHTPLRAETGDSFWPSAAWHK
jgi:hypothetical protein